MSFVDAAAAAFIRNVTESHHYKTVRCHRALSSDNATIYTHNNTKTGGLVVKGPSSRIGKTCAVLNAPPPRRPPAARLPTDKLLIKIYVMENIYHYKITAISEETQTETVTNAGQGLNVLTI